MSEESKIKYINNFRLYNRATYVLFLILVLLIRGSEVTKSIFFLVYYLAVFAFLLGFDEFVFKERKNKFPALFFRIRTYVHVVLVATGGIFINIPTVFYGALFLYIIYIIGQDLIFTDVFNTFMNYTKRVSLGLYTGLTMCVLQFRDSLTGVWMLISFLALAIVTASFVFMYICYYNSISVYDDRYTKLYFKNADMIAENKKLLKFQERVEKVNNEINYQKINLTKANDDLAKINEETRSLIDVMKYFAASFDVEKNAHVMLQNVVNIKETGAVALYIDKDVYMNEEPYLEIISDNGVAESLLKQDISNIYETIKKRKSVSPLVLCDNYDFKYPFLTGGNMCNAVVFPAYENDYVYGGGIIL